jgi:ABC-type transport system substrate-binding protein
MTFLRTAAAVTLVAAASLAAVAATAQPAADTLRVRLNADIRSTDPGVNRDGNTDAVVLHVVEGLVGFRDDTSVGPMLAERVYVAPDGLSYTFRLREGVRNSAAGRSRRKTTLRRSGVSIAVTFDTPRPSNSGRQRHCVAGSM